MSGTAGGLIGGAPSGFLAAEMDGSIDEVRIYNHALTAAEVQLLYQNK